MSAVISEIHLYIEEATLNFLTFTYALVLCFNICGFEEHEDKGGFLLLIILITFHAWAISNREVKVESMSGVHYRKALEKITLPYSLILSVGSAVLMWS